MNAPATDRSHLHESVPCTTLQFFNLCFLQRSILETIRSQAARLQVAACTAKVCLHSSSCHKTGLCRHRPKAAAIVS